MCSFLISWCNNIWESSRCFEFPQCSDLLISNTEKVYPRLEYKEYIFLYSSSYFSHFQPRKITNRSASQYQLFSQKYLPKTPNQANLGRLVSTSYNQMLYLENVFVILLQWVWRQWSFRGEIPEWLWYSGSQTGGTFRIATRNCLWLCSNYPRN